MFILKRILEEKHDSFNNAEPVISHSNYLKRNFSLYRLSIIRSKSRKPTIWNKKRGNRLATPYSNYFEFIFLPFSQ